MKEKVTPQAKLPPAGALRGTRVLTGAGGGGLVGVLRAVLLRLLRLRASR